MSRKDLHAASLRNVSRRSAQMIMRMKGVICHFPKARCTAEAMVACIRAVNCTCASSGIRLDLALVEAPLRLRSTLTTLSMSMAMLYKSASGRKHLLPLSDIAYRNSEPRILRDTRRLCPLQSLNMSNLRRSLPVHAVTNKGELITNVASFCMQSAPAKLMSTLGKIIFQYKTISPNTTQIHFSQATQRGPKLMLSHSLCFTIFRSSVMVARIASVAQIASKRSSGII